MWGGFVEIFDVLENQIIFYSCQIQELFCNPGCLRPFSSPFSLSKPWIFTSPKLSKNAQRLACQVYPVQGLDGIRTLNPGLESVSQLEFLEISALRIFFCFFGWLVTHFFCLVKSFSWRPVGKTPSQRQAGIGLMGSWECKGTPPKIGTMVVINNLPIRAPFFPHDDMILQRIFFPLNLNVVEWICISRSWFCQIFFLVLRLMCLPVFHTSECFGGQVPKAGLGFQWITTLHIYKVKLMSYFQRFGLENIEV